MDRYKARPSIIRWDTWNVLDTKLVVNVATGLTEAEATAEAARRNGKS